MNHPNSPSRISPLLERRQSHNSPPLEGCPNGGVVLPRFIYFSIVTILLLSILYNVGSVLWQQRTKYLSHSYWDNYRSLEQKYLDSQYINKHPKAWLRDEVVFSYAGGALISGTNPVLIIPDAPPLGKYLIGISVLIFDNENIIVAIFGVVSLFILFLISLQILKDNLLALLPPFFFSLEPMFKNQFIYTPLLDIFQLVFVLSYFYLINKAFLAKKQAMVFFISASIFLGLFISTKFFISGITIFAASLIRIIIDKKKDKLIKILATLPVSIGILLFSYARVFAFGYSFHQFLGIQKWVFLYHKSQIILPFSVWPLLLFNRWYVWFGDKPVITDSQWFITWPIITLISFITMILYISKKIPQRKEIEVIMLWSVLYLLFLSAGQIFSRYFIILLPMFYIITIYGLFFMSKKIISITKNSKSQASISK